MADLVVPAALRFARSSFRYVDQTGASRGAYSAVVQTTGYGGDHVAGSIDFTPHGGRTTLGKTEMAQLRAFLMSLKGKQNRTYAQDNSNTRRGSFPAVELFTNTDFNGTTGWLSTAKYAVSASDGVLRSTILQPGAGGYPAYQSPAYTLYAPYATRILVRIGRGTFSSIYPLLDNDVSTPLTSSLGYGVRSSVAQNASNQAGVYDAATTGNTAGDYFETLFASCARCILVDGSGNLLLRSDEIGTSPWTAGTNTFGANAAASPDGTTTADSIIESNSVNTNHYAAQTVTVTSAVQDICITVAVKASTRTWAAIGLQEATGATSALVWVNLSTGALGTVQNGANWANARATVVNMGNGWYRVSLVARKTNAATSVVALIFSATADASAAYAGSAATVATLMWRASMTLSNVPALSTQTTSAAVAASTPSGSALSVKGLPVSTAGLLLAGDWVEIDGQLKMVTASLDSDAAGLGYLQFSPPLARAIADSTPIIVHKPMGRFILSGDSAGWSNEPGPFSSASLELEEAALS